MSTGETKLRWQRAHRDKTREYERRWRERHPGAREAVVQDWRARHPAAVKVMNAKAGRKWSATHRGARNAITASRRAAKRSAMPPWVTLDSLRPIYVEAQRVSRATGVPHEVDHVFPLRGPQSCGLHVPKNLRVIARSENRAKRNQEPEGVWTCAS